MIKFALYSVAQLSDLQPRGHISQRGSAADRALKFTAIALLLLVPSLLAQDLSLSRPVRSWEFLSATGTRAAVFGNESGNFEAWVYPLKIFRDFHLVLHLPGRVIAAETLARTVTVHPESSSILYASDDFQIRETLFVPVHEAGAIILLETETRVPLEIDAVFQRDFQLEWPAAIGGSYIDWNPNLHSFVMGEEQKKFAAMVGSPAGSLGKEEYFTNYSSSTESSIFLGPSAKGKETKLVVIAASTNGLAEAQQTYDRLSSTYTDLRRDSADYYRKYLSQTISLDLPDQQLQQSYDWARISILQGMVNNPDLGTGLVAGYRTSGTYERPGFAWFFGRDSLWTDLALDSEGDFDSTRTALDFISHYQREDGKIPHEIAQTASLVPWFQDYPYGYASADATPLYIIATDDYVRQSGDLNFVQEKWDSLWKAYQFLKSTYGPHELPQNLNIGHGWVEGGPLLPVETEFYQSGLGTQALNSLTDLARVLNKNDAATELRAEFTRQKQLLNQTFWSGEKGTYAFALDESGQRIEIPSVLATVPMWFDLLDPAKAESTIDQLAGPDHEADWGMRIIASSNPLYSPAGYHFGSVWPLFTGWASVGEYRYHRSLPAYENLRANALLALDGSLGHVTEVLSGDYYQPLSTSSPHQIWSAAMVVSPILRGLLGLQVDAITHQVRFAPHVPAEWKSFSVHDIKVGNSTININFHRTEDEIALDIRRDGSSECNFEFSPALSPRAQVLHADLNNRAIPVHSDVNSEDQHATVRFPLGKGANILRIHLRDDFAIGYSSSLPSLGDRSRGLRILSQSWQPDTLTLHVSGVSGQTYLLSTRNGEQVSRVEGGELVKSGNRVTGVSLHLPGTDTNAYVSGTVIVHLSTKINSAPK